MFCSVQLLAGFDDDLMIFSVIFFKKKLIFYRHKRPQNLAKPDKIDVNYRPFHAKERLSIAKAVNSFQLIEEKLTTLPVSSHVALT